MIRLNYEFLVAASTSLAQAGLAHETVRTILYWDKQTNGAGIVTTDLLATSVYNAYRALDSAKRFTTLYDKTKTFNTTAIGAGDGTTNDSERVVRDYQCIINKNVFIPIEYSSTTGAITEIKTNNIGILILAKHGSRMKLDISLGRIRYIDY